MITPKGLERNERIDIHAGERVVLYRHFIELIVRVSFLKYGDISNLHRSVEKLIVHKIPVIFESKKLPTKSMNALDD